MSTPKKSATPVASKSAAPTPSVPKAPKKPRIAALSAVQKFELLLLVKNADPTVPDATLAAQATDLFGRPVLPLTIAGHRRAFGLASVGKPTAAQLLAENAALKAKVIELETALKFLPPGDPAAAI